ncbi:hypothetical protein IV203_030833 [Nitzschia inconspicua]|uniref:Plastid lipid-associated protein/fibrillin conserved domain-containing protein n=1 Tax=Nitzschia inconspicua TaxID=303405 RepID=A0A9K3LT78_9STRA|nr:hypothetical protein IV203_030833 [Nitzschia inconspicua]
MSPILHRSNSERSLIATSKSIMKASFLSLLGCVTFRTELTRAFLTAKYKHQRVPRDGGAFPTSLVTLKSSSLCVDELLDQVTSEQQDLGIIQELITSLSEGTIINDENTGNTTIPISDKNTVDPTLFHPLLGHYNVSYTLTTRPKDNPVGGKWTRWWKVRRTLQHILPARPTNSNMTEAATPSIGQVVNAIRLDLLWGIIGIWVLLRGDAIPLSQDLAEKTAAGKDVATPSKGSPALLPNLSNRTVRVYFDKPRIGFRLFRGGTNDRRVVLERVLSIGPTSSVVLDTPYVDNRIRLGRGGTSGSQFVFARVSEEDEEAIEGWKWVLAESTRNVMNKNQAMLRVGILGLISTVVYKQFKRTIFRWVSGASAIGSALVLAWLALSTGGIETNGDTYTKGR